MVYFTLGTLLTLFEYNLSDFGRFRLAIAQLTLERLEAFSQFEALPPAIIPAFEFTLLGQFFFFVPWILMWMTNLGYLYYVLGITRGETLGYRALFEGFNFFFRAIWVRLLRLILVGLGTLLFIVPGIVFLCAFSQVNYLLLDNPDKGTVWLFKESWRLMRGRKREYLMLLLSFTGWFLLTNLTVVVPILGYAAQFWLIAYSTFTMVNYYLLISGGESEPPESGWKRPGMF